MENSGRLQAETLRFDGQREKLESLFAAMC